jgi:hypothetical protein
MTIVGLVKLGDCISLHTEFFKCEISDFKNDFQLNLVILKKAENKAHNALKQLRWLD